MRICIFCGSNIGTRDSYRVAASELGSLLARERHVVVYGGATAGLMGVLADAALAAGGEVIGVIPRFLDAAGIEIVHRGLTSLVVVETLHERKAAMAERADAFVVLPGGYGTFDELFETLTWAQLGLHRAPTFLIDIEGFFTPLLAMIDHAVDAGFVRASHRDLFCRVPRVEDLPPALAAFQLRDVRPKWLDKK